MHITRTPRIRSSPFYEATIAAGATGFTVYNRMLMPMSYGDLEAEYRRLVQGVAMWDVAAERQVEVQGPDADECVQYLVARDLSKVKVGQGKYVAVCAHDGTLLNDPVLLKLSDRYWFSLADSELLLWVRAVAAEKGFAVEVCEPDVSPLAVQGPLAEDLIVDLFGPGARDLRYFWFSDTSLDDIPLVLCRSGWSKQGGFELFLRDGSRGTELWDRVAEAGERYGIGPGTPNHIERVESGLLSYGGDTTPESNPFEAGIGRYVNVDIEPDFVGKAALQQIAADGPKRLLTGLVVDVPGEIDWPLPERQPVLQDGRQVGTISALVFSPRMGQTIGIAQIDRLVVEAGRPVQISSPEGPQSATFHELPFL